MATCQTPHQIYMLLNMMTRRLDDNNFIIWRYQFQTVLEGQDLFGYIDGSTLSPTKYVITDDEGVTDEVSTAYKEWKKTDKAILSLLLATLSFDTMDYVVGSKTSREAWIRLNDRYNTFSRSHVMQLKNEMYTITKGMDSVEIYLQKVTRARNKLDALGVRMEDEDIVVVVLNGLPAEFNLIKAIIRGRNSPIAMHELRILLLAIERDIANRAGLNLPTFSATTTKKNVSQRCLDGNENRSTSHGGYKNNFWSSPQCQICRKKGHTAVRCFYRNIVPPDQPSNFVIICQLCDMKGHTALNCHQRYCAFQEANPPSTLTALTVHNIIRAASSRDSTFTDGFSSVLHPASTRSPCASLGTHIGVSPVVVDGGDQNIGIVKKKTFQECCTYSHITGQTMFDKYHDATEVKTFEVANSVHSAADGGVKVGVEAINQYQVMMTSVAFLIILFSVRNFGTSKVGLAMGHALFIWFCFLGEGTQLRPGILLGVVCHAQQVLRECSQIFAALLCDLSSIYLFALFCRVLCWDIWVKLHILWRISMEMIKLSCLQFQLASRTSHRHNKVFFYQGKYAKDFIHIAEKGCKGMIHYFNKFLLYSKPQTFSQKGDILQASRCIPISVF